MGIVNPYGERSDLWLKGALHLHSTNSDGSDSPAEVIHDYERLGFDFIALTDHNALPAATDIEVETSMVVFSGCEYRGAKWKPEVGVIGCKKKLPFGGLTVKQYLDAAADSGGVTVFNHPQWVFNHWTPLQMLTHERIHALEVYNAAVEELPGSADVSPLWDEILSTGRRIWGVASDDAHHAPYRGRAWVMVRAEKNRIGILEALKAGRFYASSGVVIDDVRFESGRLIVESADAEVIRFIARNGSVVQRTEGSKGSYIVREDDVYIRAELHGRGTQKAWTNPLFIDSPASFKRSETFRRYVIKQHTNAGKGERLLMFDFDGVIADTLDAFHSGLVKACRQHGYELFADRETFLHIFDQNMSAGLADAGISTKDIPLVIEALGEAMGSSLPLFSGMGEMLNFLAELHPVYIITSNISSLVAAVLKQQGVRGIRDVLGSDKEPCKIKKIRNLIEQYPEHIPFYTGDTAGDMMESRLAGARSVAVGWGWHDEKRLRAARPDYFVPDVEELQDILT